MDTIFERQLKLNIWFIKARVLFLSVLFLVAFCLRLFVWQNYNIGNFFIFAIIFLYLADLLLYWRTKKLADFISKEKLNIIGFFQIIIDFSALVLAAFFAGGMTAALAVFGLLPVIAAAAFFGPVGALGASTAAALLNIAFAILKYYQAIGGVDLNIAKSSLVANLIEPAVVGAVYLAVALFFTYFFRLLGEREKTLDEAVVKMSREKETRIRELDKVNETAKRLIERDVELLKAGKEMDKQIKEIADSRKSIAKLYKEAQQAGEEVEEEKNKTVAIISNFASPIIVLDKDDKISFFNSAARKILGLNYLDYGRRINNENNYCLENFKDVIRIEHECNKREEDPSQEYLQMEELSLKYGKQEMIYKVVTAKISGKNGENLGVMKIFYDLTREKILDKLKSEFISIAAHQLRTPLAAIKWVFEMVLSGDVGDINDEQRKFLNQGYHSNERIIVLVNDLLNVSRIEEGRFGYIFGQHNFLDILNEVVACMQMAIARSNIKLTITKPDKLPPINMDKSRINMALQNILENSVKYTPEHGKVDIEVTRGEKELKVAIKDNGVGIPEKDKVKLFSKFFRASNVMRMQTEGSGLGLFIVKNIIEKHGGQLTLDSEEGKGTTVIFTLPLV